MRKIMLSLVVIFIVVTVTSCARGISPEQAANGKAKCGKTYIR